MKKSDRALNAALAKAKAAYEAGNASDEEYCKTIRDLRNSIRNLKGTVLQAENKYLNLFRQGGAF